MPDQIHPLQARRFQHGASRDEFAGAVGIGSGTLYEIERWRRPASEKTVRMIASALDIEVDEARALCPWPRKSEEGRDHDR